MANIAKLDFTAEEINEKLGKVTDPIEVVQEAGDSETAVMSQRAVKEYTDTKISETVGDELGLQAVDGATLIDRDVTMISNLDVYGRITSGNKKVAIEDQVNKKVSKSGDTMTGKLVAPQFEGELLGNASSASKLKEKKNIYLDEGVTGPVTEFDGSSHITIPVTSIKEAYLEWGGKNIKGAISPVDAAASNIHSANRFAFAQPAGITIEYSNDGGVTYTVLNASSAAKTRLVSGIGDYFHIGNHTTGVTINDKLRITLEATAMGVYTKLRKLLINISTNGAIGSYVNIEASLKQAPTFFEEVATYPIDSDSGWNSIPFNGIYFGGEATQHQNTNSIRLTFGITGLSEGYQNNLGVYDIYAIGDTYQSISSNLARTGHLYDYDYSQNAIFPGNITATAFLGVAEKAMSDSSGNLIDQTYAKKEEIEPYKTQTADLAKRVDILEDTSIREMVVSSKKYITSVPDNIRRYALLSKVGGLTRKSGKGAGRNRAKIIGFSARDIVSFSDYYTTNDDGTTISTTLAGDEITVTQKNYNASADWVFNTENGYFNIIFDTDLEEGEEFTFYCKAEITDDLTGYNSRVNVRPYSIAVSDGTIYINNGYLIFHGTWQKHPSGRYRPHIHIRLGGLSIKFSHFMLERGHTNGPYEPYCEELQSSKVTAIKSIGKNLYDKDNTEEKGYLTKKVESKYVLYENDSYRSVFIDVSRFDKVTVSIYKATTDFQVMALEDKSIGAEGSTTHSFFPSKTFNLTSYNFKVKYILVSVEGSSFYDVAPYIQVEAGDTATEYAPYRETIYSIPEAITGREEYGLGIIADGKIYSNYVDFDNEKYYPNRVKRYKKYIDLSWEEAKHPSTDEVMFVAPVTKITSVMCNYYETLTEELYNKLGSTGVYVDTINNERCIVVKDRDISSIGSFAGHWQILSHYSAAGIPLTFICGIDDNTSEFIAIDSNVITVDPYGSIIAVNEGKFDAYTEATYVIAKGDNA